MNTKTFAQLSRQILLKGVATRLRYWGFDEKGKITDMPDAIGGGVLFRGEVFDDPALIKRWESLRSAVLTKGRDQVLEEAAYTWFNRIMAIRILAKNGYDLPQLEYAEGGQRLPLLLQRARRGTHPFLNAEEAARFQKISNDFSRETEAFAILLIGYCHAHPLLHRVFGSIDDYTELLLPANILAEDGFLHLLNTTDAISDEEYKQVELIGWLYQFYISEKKDEVFASFKKNKKAEAKDIPAATQIFTPNWIVKYMVENTVGKLWLDLHPDSPLKADMKYLVESPDPHPSSLIPHPSLIEEASQLKLFDPAAGSGHILVEGFDLLYRMYRAEYYTPEEAVESILSRNLYGLDIDKRAAQLARFAVLLKAAKEYPDVLKKDGLPQVYAMPEPMDFSRQDVLDFLGKDGAGYEEKLSAALRLMKQAQNLGSIMQFDLPEAAVDFIEKRWQDLQTADNLTFHEKTILPAMSGYIPVLLTLCRKYEAVVANPPYMGSGNMNADLKIYINQHYSTSKSDLCSVFIEFMPMRTEANGLFSFIVPPSWMFILIFEELRRKVLSECHIISLLHLSRGIFGADFGSMSAVMRNASMSASTGVYFKLVERTFQEFHQRHLQELFLKTLANVDFKFDFSNYSKEINNIEHSDSGNRIYYSDIHQGNFSKIPGSPFAYWMSDSVIKLFNQEEELGQYFETEGQNKTSDNVKYIRYLWEVSQQRIGESKKWNLLAKGGQFRKWSGNIESLIDWSEEARLFYRKDKSARIIPNEYWFRKGVTWSDVISGAPSFRLLPENATFETAGPSLFPYDEELIPGFLALLNSGFSKYVFDILNPTIHLKIKDVRSLPVIPMILADEKINELAANCVELSSDDWDSHETSWDFQTTPLLNGHPSLEAASQAWSQAASRDFFQLHANEEELNRIFIGIYGLEEELTPDVPLKDITILQEELDSKALEALEPAFRSGGAAAIELPIKRDVVMQQFISWAMGIFMGRYRLDQPGLHIAHPNPTAEETAPYVVPVPLCQRTTNNEQRTTNFTIDEDAIVPLMGSACDFPDDAVHRFKELLDILWGQEHRTENLNFLQDCLDMDLEKYLVKNFWPDHCKRYKKKPIYWLFSSPKGAFQVLVYMHRMNAFTVEKIRAHYLMPHLKNLRSKTARMEAQATSLSSQEARTLDRLRKDLQECEEYDLVLKDVADRQIVFDLDDGVSVNYEKFEEVVAKIK